MKIRWPDFLRRKSKMGLGLLKLMELKDAAHTQVSFAKNSKEVLIQVIWGTPPYPPEALTYHTSHENFEKDPARIMRKVHKAYLEAKEIKKQALQDLPQEFNFIAPESGTVH